MIVTKRKTAGGNYVRFTHVVVDQHQSTSVHRVATRERVGTALKSRIEKLITIKTGKGCGCQNLATQMDGWGIAGCEQRRGEIVNHLVGNREILVAAMKDTGHLGHAAGLAVEFLPEIMLRAGADWLLNQAIEDARNQPKPVPRVRRSEQPRTARRSVRHHKKSEQRPPARFIFEPNPAWTSQVRHLTFHIWATKKHDGWKWNLQQLAKRWTLFNGVKILGVALSHDAETAATIVEYATSLGIAFDHVIGVQNNTKLREVVTWIPMLEQLRPQDAGDNEVVFSAHAKGVRHEHLTNTLETWARIMYEACLDDWPAVDDQLSKYLATGAFKRYNNFTTAGNDCFHYSGTFFWWRLKAIGQRDWRRIDQQFYGTESWLGLQCKNEETGCLFEDECKDMYQTGYNAQMNEQWKARNET